MFSETCEEPCDELNEIVYRWVYVKDLNRSIVDNEIEAAAEQYEWRVLPPFFETLSNYMELKNQQFNCPGMRNWNNRQMMYGNPNWRR